MAMNFLWKDKMISIGTFRIAQTLCSVNNDEQTVTFTDSLENLYATLSTYLLAVKAARLPNLNYEHLNLLGHYLNYLSLRITDLTLRLQLMDWFWCKSWQEERQDELLFYAYAPLFIKDFHIDVIAVMDAIAPIVILATQDLKEEDQTRLPGFPDILPESKRSYRQHLPDDLRAIIDETLRWYPQVKAIRDLLAHRDHLKLVYGLPSDGKLFQVYDKEKRPQIIDEVLLFKPGNNVVDFEKYASFIWAELLVLLHRLGQSVASHAKISLHQMFLRQTKLLFIVRSWEAIIREVENL